MEKYNSKATQETFGKSRGNLILSYYISIKNHCVKMIV